MPSLNRVSLTVDGERPIYDRNHHRRNPALVDLEDHETRLPVRRRALQVLRLPHIHQVAYLDTPHGVDIGVVPEGLRQSGKPVRVAHDHTLAEADGGVQCRLPGVLGQPDTTLVAVCGYPTRGQLVE